MLSPFLIWLYRTDNPAVILMQCSLIENYHWISHSLAKTYFYTAWAGHKASIHWFTGLICSNPISKTAAPHEHHKNTTAKSGPQVVLNHEIPYERSYTESSSAVSFSNVLDFFNYESVRIWESLQNWTFQDCFYGVMRSYSQYWNISYAHTFAFLIPRNPLNGSTKASWSSLPTNNLCSYVFNCIFLSNPL